MIPVSGPGLIPDSANQNSETYMDSSLPAPLNQLRWGKNKDFYWNDLLLLRQAFPPRDANSVTAAGNFTVWPSVFPVISAESRIPSLRTGSARPYLVVNRILICSGGLGLPHQQGWGSCSGVLSTLLSGATVFATSTKR